MNVFEYDDIIHGDRFVEICDYAIKENDDKIDDKMLDKNGLIFVKTDQIFNFFEAVREKPFNYVIVSHNSDHNITEEIYRQKPPNVLHWFAQNVRTKQSDLTPIPIGIERPCVSGLDTVRIILDASKREADPTNIAYVNFSWQTNPNARQPIIHHYKEFPWVTMGERIPLEAYLSEIKKHVYVFCPPGNGWDTHRFWETLYMNRIPIVYDCPFPKGDVTFVEAEIEHPPKLLDLIYNDVLEFYRDTYFLKFKNWEKLIKETVNDLLHTD
jgi:hypothetical protein